MHDAHVHLDFMTNAEQVAADAAAAGVGLFANTVTPEGYAAASTRFEAFDNVHLGCGLHPWWVDGSSGQSQCLTFESLGLAQQSMRYVGEVGLDLGKRHAETADAQIAAFKRIAHACSERGGLVISLHSVHAAQETLDILESSGALETCTCLFHWFTGPSDQLKRAVDAGCYFSVGPRMLATGKGREYVKAIPAKRLLLETDAPPGQGVTYSFDELNAELETAAAGIAAIKGEGVLETIDETFYTLFAR